MEDSEQRKKRLKEMRAQADLAEASEGVEGSGSGMPGFLSNPLNESSPMPSRDKSITAPRFDFYTDPMAAFSSKERSHANTQVALDYFPRPNFGGSPMAQFSSPHPDSMNSQVTPSPTQVSPAPYRNPVWNGPRGPVYYNFPFRPSSGGTSPSPGFEPRGGPIYNSARGIIHQPSHVPNPSPEYRSSHSPSPGSGRGFRYNSRSPMLGRDSGRGRSSHGHWSNEDRPYGPDRFYKRSMVEDPWKLLKPVIWEATDASLNTLYTPEHSKSWTSKSISTKTGGSSTASVKTNSQPSLAEYLAAAFNDATNDAENV